MSEVKETKSPEVQPEEPTVRPERAPAEGSTVLENGLTRLTSEEAARAGKRLAAIVDNVETVIIGKRQAIELVVMSLITGGHVLLEDVPGVGKTTLALAFSRALGLRYTRVQFTPDVTPSDIVGFSVYEKDGGTLAYKPGAVMCNLLLADEINRTSSKTQSALLEVMEEGRVTVDGVTRPLPDPFIVIATQNPVGSLGTHMLPQSQLDRFTVRLHMGYPDIESQVNILRERRTDQPLDAVRQVTDAGTLAAMRGELAGVHMGDELLEYIARLAQLTRDHELVQLGLSPRGALALSRMARANAFMLGRDYVVPEDVTAVLPDVCAHRLILHPRTRLAEVSAEDILGEITAAAPVPGGR